MPLLTPSSPVLTYFEMNNSGSATNTYDRQKTYYKNGSSRHSCAFWFQDLSRASSYEGEEYNILVADHWSHEPLPTVALSYSSSQIKFFCNFIKTLENNSGNTVYYKFELSLPRSALFTCTNDVNGWNLVTIVASGKNSESYFDIIINGLRYGGAGSRVEIPPFEEMFVRWGEVIKHGNFLVPLYVSNFILMEQNVADDDGLPSSHIIRQERLLFGKKPKFYGQFGEGLFSAMEKQILVSLPIDPDERPRMGFAPVVLNTQADTQGPVIYMSNKVLKKGDSIFAIDSFLKSFNPSLITQGSDLDPGFSDTEYEKFIININYEASLDRSKRAH